ncbi:coatomer subunit delta-like [Apostichopus japonicus]|uniref:coatomer subunit delta-like n=1 Tax=Stichopus japonicus TaxID=307972 RepID=UPI003AB2D3C3
MVLLAAAICTKSGKGLVARQFVEMTRARIEGLLAAFPKLMNTGKQHTFVETESVRYVYQPLEKLYMLLITTKASNILEDLETLRLFSRAIPEYCRAMEEQEILDHAFELIFAFDEIVALGYRESVNLAQIRTFTEMDSHEEKMFEAVRESQEKEAQKEMKKRMGELMAQRKDAAKKGRDVRSGGFGSSVRGGGSSGGGGGGMDTMIEPRESKQVTKPTKSLGKGMKLGSKSKDVNSFLDKLTSEGQDVISEKKTRQSANMTKATTPAAKTENIHIQASEKMSVTASRDGGLEGLEVHGILQLRVANQEDGLIKIHVDNNDDKGAQLQTHPNVDKNLFNTKSVIGMKQSKKPFPAKLDVGVLKWRFQTQDESLMPLSINCWPSENNDGGCDVNIEYELQLEDMELQDVSITIPVPSGVGAPVVGEIDGEYHHDNRKNILEWTLPVINSENKSGSLEFSIAGSPDDFFPVNVNFFAKRTYCNIQPDSIVSVEGNRPVKHSLDTVLLVEKYEIV